MKSVANYFNCNQLHNNCSFLSNLLQYCAVRSTLDLVQLDVVPLAVNLLWLHSQFSRSLRKLHCNYVGQCSIIPLCQVLQNIAAVSCSFYQPVQQGHLKHYFLSLSIILQPHCWTACRQRAMAAVAKHTFVSWVTSSLYHNVTGILFSCLVNHRMICVQMRHEC